MRTIFPAIRVLPLLCLLLLAETQIACRMRNPLRNPLKPLTENMLRSGDLSREGNAAMAQGNWEEAESKLREAVQINQKEGELRIHYAEALWMRGKRGESIAQLLEAAKTPKGFDSVRLMELDASLAEKLIVLGQYETSISWANRCIREAPKDFRGWQLRGRALSHIGEQRAAQGKIEESDGIYLESRNDYFKALSLAPPENRDLLPELAQLQMKMRQPEHALASWQNLRRLYTRGTEPVNVLVGEAETLLMLGRCAEAADRLAIASVHDPANLTLCLRRAEIEIETGRFEQADKTLQHAYRLAPNNPGWGDLHNRLRLALNHRLPSR